MHSSIHILRRTPYQQDLKSYLSLKNLTNLTEENSAISKQLYHLHQLVAQLELGRVLMIGEMAHMLMAMAIPLENLITNRITTHSRINLHEETEILIDGNNLILIVVRHLTHIEIGDLDGREIVVRILTSHQDRQLTQIGLNWMAIVMAEEGTISHQIVTMGHHLIHLQISIHIFLIMKAPIEHRDMIGAGDGIGMPACHMTSQVREEAEVQTVIVVTEGEMIIGEIEDSIRVMATGTTGDIILRFGGIYKWTTGSQEESLLYNGFWRKAAGSVRTYATLLPEPSVLFYT